jgi:tetratricopeptide (TPR) repeat protein
VLKLRILSARVVSKSVPSTLRISHPLLPFVILIAVVATATSAQKQVKAGQPYKPAATAKAPSGSIELQARVQALEAAKQSGDPAVIMNASRKVAALTFRQLGRSKLELGSAAEAVDLYRRSLDLEDSSAAHVELAAAYSSSGQVDEGISQTTNLLLTDAGNAQAWRVQGQIWMLKADSQYAAESLQQSASLQADGYTSYLLGTAFLHAKEPEKANAVFRDLLKQSNSRRELPGRCRSRIESRAGVRSQSGACTLSVGYARLGA